MPDIKKFQVVTGQTVIGAVVEETDTTITLEYALGIHVVQKSAEQFGLQLVPYDPADPEGQTKFSRAQIVSESVTVPVGLVKAYTERTSNIQIISAMDQIEGLR